MKIVWWIDHLGHGGSQKVLSDILKGLSNVASHQALVCLNDCVDFNLFRQIEKIGVEVRISGKWKLISGITLVQTWWWLRRNKYDVAVTFLYYSDVLGLLLSRLSGIQKLISSQRSSNKHYSYLNCWILRRSLSLADIIVLNSDNYRHDVERYIPAENDGRVIPNGISFPDCQGIKKKP